MQAAGTRVRFYLTMYRVDIYITPAEIVWCGVVLWCCGVVVVVVVVVVGEGEGEGVGGKER